MIETKYYKGKEGEYTHEKRNKRIKSRQGIPVWFP
jgi:hypothetical protein